MIMKPSTMEDAFLGDSTALTSEQCGTFEY